MEAFTYRPRHPPRGHHPGVHAGKALGESGHYAGSEPLHGPVGRFDLRATLLDPWQRLHIKRFQTRVQTTLVAVVDFSHSMEVKRALLSEVVRSIAYSAYDHHDRFSLWLATDRAICLLPPKRFGGMVALAERCLREHAPRGLALEALLEISARLPRESLVFLLSDFHFEERELRRLAEHYSHHDTVPLVIWSKEEQALPNRYGWLRLRDPESGREQTLFLRPRIAEAFRRKVEMRKKQLRETFQPYGRLPLFLKFPFSAQQLTEYFRR